MVAGFAASADSTHGQVGKKSRPPWGHGGRDARAAGEKSARTGGGGSVGACRAVPGLDPQQVQRPALVAVIERIVDPVRSEEHTSELQSLMRISYAVFCLKKKKKQKKER